MSKRTPIGPAALKAIKDGFEIFPLRENRKDPVYSGGCRDATRSEKAVKIHWRRYPNHNYGIAAGKDLFFLDVDGPAGEASLQALCSMQGSLPQTVTVLTANGRHIYFKSGGVLIGNSAGKLGPGLDVRGDGGYVVGAGSIHPSGHVYRYADGLAPESIAIAEGPQWLLRLARKASRPPTAAPAPPAPRSKRARAFGEAALDRENQRLASAPLHQRNNTLNRCAYRLGQLVGAGSLDEPEIITRLTSTALQIGLTADEIERTIRSGIDAGKRSPRLIGAPAPKATSVQLSRPEDDSLATELAKLGCTDTDNAQRFATRAGAEFTHCPERGWLAWDGNRWQSDTAQQRVLAAMQVSRQIPHEIAHLTDKTDQEQRAGHAKQSESKAAIDRMLALAAPMMTVSVTKLDADPWMLNVMNGTIDLRTGRLLPHDSRDMITKLAPVKYDPAAKAPQFTAFMNHVLDGNNDLYRYLQRVVGYTLTGRTTEQVFFYVKGAENNGKSTLINSIRDMLGDYGIHTSTQTLMVKDYDNNIPNDLARLAGARMVTAIEATPGRQLDEARIKAMTGGDPLTARFMRAEWFQFVPTFKLFFVANDDPRVRSTDNAMWRRIRVIPFDVVIPATLRDPNLPDKLKAEYPGILAWAVRGCLLWQRFGLGTPDVVMAATTSYRKRADHVVRFIRECIIQEERAETASSTVYQAYRTWCDANHERPLSTAQLKRELEDRGYQHLRTKAGSVWRHVRLRR